MLLTWTNLTRSKPGATFADPAVPGLRYRVRRGGTFAEYRHKAEGRWRAVALGALPQPGSLAGTGPEKLEQLLEPVRAAARSRRKSEDAGAARLAVPPGGSSLKALIDDYLKHVVADRRPRTQIECKRHLERVWKPLHDRPVTEIRKADIAERLLKVKVDQGPVATNRSRATLHAMFVWAEGVGKIDECRASRPRC